MRRAAIGESEAEDVETVLLLKSFDGVTRYVKPTNPLATQAFADGPSPVWKLNLKDVPTDAERSLRCSSLRRPAGTSCSTT